jgi:hypothetical protein
MGLQIISFAGFEMPRSQIILTHVLKGRRTLVVRHETPILITAKKVGWQMGQVPLVATFTSDAVEPSCCGLSPPADAMLLYDELIVMLAQHKVGAHLGLWIRCLLENGYSCDHEVIWNSNAGLESSVSRDN